MYGEIDVEHWKTKSNEDATKRIVELMRVDHDPELPGIGVLGKESMKEQLARTRIYAGYWGELRVDVIHMGRNQSKIVLQVPGNGRRAVSGIWRRLRPAWRWKRPRLMEAWVKEEESDKEIVGGVSRLKADVFNAETARLLLIAGVAAGAAWRSQTLSWLTAAPAVVAVLVAIGVGVYRRISGVIKWN